MELKISPTLLDSFEWYLRCPASWKQQAYKDLVAKLQRKPFVESAAIRKGKQFEETIQLMALDLDNGLTVSGPKYYVEIANACQGGVWQEWHKCTFDVGYNVEVKCYGKFDVFFPQSGLIIDLKTTGRTPNINKYLNGWQSKFYPHMVQSQQMIYIVATWLNPGDEVDTRISGFTHISVKPDLTTVKDDIVAELKKFYAWLQMNRPLWKDYVEIYSKNGEGSVESVKRI